MHYHWQSRKLLCSYVVTSTACALRSRPVDPTRRRSMTEPLGFPALSTAIPKDQALFTGIHNFAQDVFDTVREPLIVLDAAMRVRSANTAFYGTFRVAPEET